MRKALLLLAVISIPLQAEVCPALVEALERLSLTTESLAPPEAFNPKLTAVPVNLEALLAMAQEDPVFGPRLDRVMGTRTSLKDMVVALAKDGDLRRLLVQASHSDLIRRSNEERERTTSRRVDTGFVGAGLVEQNIQNSLRQQARRLVTLTYEPTNVVASTFARGGAAFFLNSTSRTADPSALRQRTSGTEDGGATGGDLNFLPGGVCQVSQFDARNNPLARSWAEAAMANRSFAEGPIKFETGIDAIERADVRGADYRAGYVLKLLATDGRFDFGRSAVITGIGEDEIPDSIPGLKAAYAKYGPQGGKNKSPRILTFSDLLNYINSTPNPFQLFAGRRVGLVGPGDSGKGVARYALRLADPEAYGLDTADVAPIEKLFWFGQPAKTCDEFTSRNRGFYADIGRGYRRDKIAARQKLSRFAEKAENVFTLTGGADESDDADVLIVTTGYRSIVGKILRAFLTPEQVMLGNDLVEQADLFRPVLAYEPSLGIVTLARQFFDPKTGNALPIYVVGPSAGRIVNSAELVGVPENFVANVNQSWRAYLFGMALAEGLGDFTPLPAEPARTEWKRASSVRNETFRPKVVPSNIVGPQAGDTILMTSELYSAFNRFDLRNIGSLTINIARQADGTYLVRVEPALSATQQGSVLGTLAQNEVFGNLLNRNIGPGQRYQSAVVEIKVGKEGQLNGETSRTRLLQEVAPVLADATPTKPAVSSGQMERLDDFFYLSTDGRSYGRTGGRVTPGRTLAAFGRRGQSRASSIFGGDVALTYDMAVKMCGADYVRRLGWRRFEGTRTEFDAIVDFIFQNRDGRTYAGSDDDSAPPNAQFSRANGPNGLVIAAGLLGRNPARAYDAVVQIFGEEYVRSLGWYRFTGTLDEHNSLRSFVSQSSRDSRSYSFDAPPQATSSAAYGDAGFMRAISIFDGDLDRTFNAAVEIYGEDAVVNNLGWRRPG